MLVTVEWQVLVTAALLAQAVKRLELGRAAPTSSHPPKSLNTVNHNFAPTVTPLFQRYRREAESFLR